MIELHVLPYISGNYLSLPMVPLVWPEVYGLLIVDVSKTSLSDVSETRPSSFPFKGHILEIPTKSLAQQDERTLLLSKECLPSIPKCSKNSHQPITHVSLLPRDLITIGLYVNIPM